MSKKVRHVLGISGGKDSAALAIYMKDKYPHLDIEYYTCDTGKELDETYQLIKNIEIYLGKKIEVLRGADSINEAPFDLHIKRKGGFIPSANARWCTKALKLEPFEKFVGNDPVVSYVGIRSDEEREGYISRKTSIQSISPFRKNIWSADVIAKMFSNQNVVKLQSLAKNVDFGTFQEKATLIISKKIEPAFTQAQKLNSLLNTDVKGFNHLVFDFLKTTDYPLATETSFPLLDNEDVLIRADIFRLLEESGVGVPAYYNKVDFELNGKTGQYSRSRSGCYFCFFQQKIEWVWLYEKHPDLYIKAMQYEKDGYSWNQEETLADLIKPERLQRIKEDYIKRLEKDAKAKSPYLIDILNDAEGEGCAACFI